MKLSSTLRPRRALTVVTLVTAAGIGLAACSSSGGTSSSAASSSVNVAKATAAKVPAGTVLKVAQQFDADELPIKLSGTKAIPSTLSIDWSNFSGGPQILQALEANAIDLGQLGDVPVAYSQPANKGLEVVAAFRYSGANNGIVTAPGENIPNLASLKGKKIAYTQATTTQAYLLRVLASVGLSKSDVTLVNIASQADVTAALTSHSVDAAAFTEPLITEYLSKNPSATEISKSSLATTSGYTYFVTTKQALQDPAKVAAIGDFLKAMVAGYQWENANEAAWVQQYYVGQQQLTTALGEKLYNLYGPYSFPSIGPAMYANQQKVINVLETNGFLPAGLKASEEFDPAFNNIVEAAASSN
jgi:sulfonate transport system substrate-binding protein